MLDENLPSFFIKPPVDNELASTILESSQGSDPQPEYILKRPNPKDLDAKNCYAIALYDPYNSDVLYAEILVRPEWAQPPLTTAEVRALNGAPAPPIPVVPNSFAIQLYNPDQQVNIKRGEKTWGTSSSWEFLLPQNSFRVPSASTLDRSQDDPAISDLTPKIAFKWKRDNKFTKDITCYMSGKSTDTKKTKEPDIIVAMFKAGKQLIIYEPNLHRVDVEDKKGMEVVLLLGALAIKDLYITPIRYIFNLSGQPLARKSSMHLIGRNNSGGVAGIGEPAPRKNSNPIPASQILPNLGRPHAKSNSDPRPPPADARTEWQIEAEGEALRAAIQAEEDRARKAREKQAKEDERQVRKLVEAEEKERKRKEMEDAKETERLRKVYGVDGQTPSLPPRPVSQTPYYSPLPNQSVHSFNSTPHLAPNPYQRPNSTPTFAPPPTQSSSSSQSRIPKIFQGPSGPSSRYHRAASGSGPYLQPSGGVNFASVSTFFGGGARRSAEDVAHQMDRRKMTKKRSVHF